MKGKNVLIVGGLGQIGINSAIIMQQAGAKVIIFDMQDLPDLNSKKTSKIDIEKVDYYQVDITIEKQVKSAVKLLKKKYGTIDVLINHSHFKGDPKKLKPHSEFFEPLDRYSFDIWKETLDVNMNGLFLISKEISSLMKQQKKGVIVNTSSTYGVVSPNASIYGDSGINSPISYAASKSAIINFTRYLATHLAAYNIRANILTPGGVKNTGQSAEFIKNYSNLTPLKRLAKPNEYQGAVLFLASDASSYMTGSNLVVDGGWTSW